MKKPENKKARSYKEYLDEKAVIGSEWDLENGKLKRPIKSYLPNK